MRKLDLKVEWCGLSHFPPSPLYLAIKGSRYNVLSIKIVGVYYFHSHLAIVLAKHNVINVNVSDFQQVYFLSCSVVSFSYVA